MHVFCYYINYMHSNTVFMWSFSHTPLALLNAYQCWHHDKNDKSQEIQWQEWNFAAFLCYCKEKHRLWPTSHFQHLGFCRLMLQSSKLCFYLWILLIFLLMTIYKTGFWKTSFLVKRWHRSMLWEMLRQDDQTPYMSGSYPGVLYDLLAKIYVYHQPRVSYWPP